MKTLLLALTILTIYSCDYRKYPQEEQWREEVQEMMDQNEPAKEPQKNEKAPASKDD